MVLPGPTGAALEHFCTALAQRHRYHLPLPPCRLRYLPTRLLRDARYRHGFFPSACTIRGSETTVRCAICLRACTAMSRTDLPNEIPYETAMCGTEMAYTDAIRVLAALG